MPEQRLVASDFAAAGYDLVVGHGPHVMQGAEAIGSMPVFYALGNFVYGSPGRFTRDQPGRGLVPRTEFGKGGLTSMTVTSIDVDNKRVAYQPRPSSSRTPASL